MSNPLMSKRLLCFAALALGPALLLAGPAESKYAPLRQTCERLYGKGVRPHVFTVYNAGNLELVRDPATLRALRDDGFGYVVLWESLNTERANPVDQRYSYIDPALVARTTAALRDYGFGVIGYIHGPKCRDSGMSPTDILDMIADFGWDGVLLDNGEVGRSGFWGVWETLDFFVRLDRMGMVIMHHSSVEPHFGRVSYRGPWAQYEDYRYQGETNTDPVDEHDSKWRYVVSQASASGAIGQFKPQNGSPLWADPGAWLPRMPALLCSPRAGFGNSTSWAGSWASFKEFYLPEYRRNAADYRRDPDAYVRRAYDRLYGARRNDGGDDDGER